jgi:hypothetical protein
MAAGGSRRTISAVMLTGDLNVAVSRTRVSLTTVRIKASVFFMRTLRPGDSREVVAAFHSSALCWRPRVFKNLGRGVF